MTLPMSMLRAPGGVSSYQHFASRLKALIPAAGSILDVGCGDGSLLLCLRSTYGRDVQLAGIDLSPFDVERARDRVPDADVCCGDVAAAQYDAGTFDLVVGHLSFALIPNLRQVFGALLHALRPGGRLAFVIEDPLAESTIYRYLAASLAPIRRHFPAFAVTTPQREAWEDDAILCALLREAGFRADVHVERFTLESRLSRDDVWEIARRFYGLGLLAADLQAEAADALRQAIVQLDADGRSRASLSLRIVAARR
jgi:SAM-dependent methyltransferase